MFDYMAAGGSVLGIYGSLEQSDATANSLDNQAKMQRQNAALAVEKGKQDALRLALFGDRTTGSIKANYSASGIASDSGTVAAVLQSSGQNMELDKLNVIHGADVRALNYNNQANLDEFGAKQALQGGYFDAMSKVFMGGSKVYSRSQAGSGGGGSYVTGDESDGD